MNNNSNIDVLVIGELNVDLILNEIESFPEMGKEKLADKMDLVLGSSSAIFSSNLSALGAKVAFIGKIGDDLFGNLVLKSLAKKKVLIDYIKIDSSLKTGATIVLNFGEDRAMVTHPGAMEHLSFADIDTTEIRNSKHLHVSSVFLQPGVKKDIIEIFRTAKDNGLTTSLDPQWDPAEKWDIELEKLLPFVDVFIPNETEIKKLTNENNINNAVESLRQYANTIVIKRGNKGSVVWNKGEISDIPAFTNNNVVDAIGAGDSFDAGFIFQFVKGKDLVECQRFANLMGALNTTAPGGTAAFTDYNSIMELAREKFGYEEKVSEP